MSTPTQQHLRLGARGSLLSRLQSQSVATALQKIHPHLAIELVIISTSGDRIQNQPLHALGGKGLFTKELEVALLQNEIDFAVHSFKDVPVTMPLVDVSELSLAATPPRADPCDVLISLHARTIATLSKNAKVGTGSLRRAAQLLALRPDLQILPIRGNIDTRIRKLQNRDGGSGEYDAIILAFAGLQRANLFDEKIMTAIRLEEMLPAAGQAALVLQCRSEDAATRKILESFNDPQTQLAVALEREIVRHLNGDCHSPIAALAEISHDQIHLRATVAARNGHPPLIHAEARVSISTPEAAISQVMQQLESQGAKKLLSAPLGE